MAKFQSRDLQAPYFVFDFTPKPSNEEIVNAFTAGLPIKKSSLPAYVYQNEDEKTEFIKKQEVQSVAFSEKKKTLRNTKVTF